MHGAGSEERSGLVGFTGVSAPPTTLTMISGGGRRGVAPRACALGSLKARQVSLRGAFVQFEIDCRVVGSWSPLDSHCGCHATSQVGRPLDPRSVFRRPRRTELGSGSMRRGLHRRHRCRCTSVDAHDDIRGDTPESTVAPSACLLYLSRRECAHLMRALAELARFRRSSAVLCGAFFRRPRRTEPVQDAPRSHRLHRC